MPTPGPHAAATRSARLAARTRLRVVAGLTACALVGVTAGAAARADDVYNTIDGETAATALDAMAETMRLVAAGAPASTTLRVQPRSSSIDGFEGCNLLQGPATFAIRSSDPGVATVEPATVEFTQCTTSTSVQERLLTVTPRSAGATTITATVVDAPSKGSFNLGPASFEVEVAPPPNTAPTVTVGGVTPGRNYDKGSAPTPRCEVTDVEDGASTFAPSLSRPAVLGPDGAPAPLDPDGLGERLARCSHTDARGSTVVASASYYLIDPTPPVVRYVLSKPRPANGWYREEVALDWIVTEPSSPRSLEHGCDRQWITPDQPATTYTCTATSAGGTTTVESEAVRKDSTPPTVTGTVTTPSVPVAGVSWYPQVPSIEWSSDDAVSGVVPGSMKATVTMAKEGRNLMARTVATDSAGNTGGTSVHYINVDASAPVVEARATSAPAYGDGTRAWFKGRVTVEVTARDPDVQPFERGSGLKVDPTGTHVVTASQRFTAKDNVGHEGTSAPVLVDAAAPVVAATCPTGPVVKGSSTGATWTASDGPDGSGLASARTGDLVLDTSTVGRKAITVPTATDNVGHTSVPTTCAYDVVYDFTGFHQPIDNGVFNTVKAGSAVPVKFGLGGDQGLGVLNGTPGVTEVACPPSTAALPLEETYPSTSTSGLKYDPLLGRYTYVWKTATSFAETCQKLTVKLADGRSQTALFDFTK